MKAHQGCLKHEGRSSIQVDRNQNTKVGQITDVDEARPKWTKASSA